MKIKVEHEVSPEKETCTHDGDFWGKSVCRYHTHRDRTHGRKAPVERHLPKCTLFDCWLERDYVKCEACKNACNEAEREKKKCLRYRTSKRVIFYMEQTTDIYRRTRERAEIRLSPTTLWQLRKPTFAAEDVVRTIG